MKIHQSYEYATGIPILEIDFKYSTHIFSGLGENFPNLIILDVTKQPIKFVERENFFGLQKLEYLHLFNNEIEFLPEDVFMDLPNLMELNLENNKIMELPEKLFMNLRKIELIIFNDNQIETLPPNLFANNLKLRQLHTRNNPLKTNDFDFSAFPNLRLFNRSSTS